MVTTPVPEAARRRLRVLHVVVPTSGAVADVALGYLRDQIERGWHVSLACPSEGPLGFDAREAGVHVRWWRAAGHSRAGTLGELSRLDDIVDAVTPDVVHLHGAKAGLVGRLLVRNKVPTVYQPHLWSFVTSSGPARNLAVRWERQAVRWTGELICLSEAERAAGARVGVVAPTTVLRPGVDVAQLEPQDERARARARAELGLPDVPTAVAWGLVGDDRGLRELREIWSRVRRARPEANLVVVGGRDEQAAAVAAHPTPGITVVSGRADVQAWLAAGDLVVSPPSWTGTSLTPLRAMACARSVVVADATRLTESIVPRGAGAVVPPDDLDAFAAEVVRRLADPELTEDEGWVGRSHVEFHHDLATSARELSRVYLRLVGSRRGR